MKREGLSILGQGRVKAAGRPTLALNPVTGAALEPNYFRAMADMEQAGWLVCNAMTHAGRALCWPERNASLRSTRSNKRWQNDRKFDNLLES